MKNILVIGGTQFFGQKAVEQLLDKGHEVTIATRGNNPHPFGKKVNHIILDAQDKAHDGWEQVTNKQWDAVFSNVCYNKDDAEIMIEKLTDVTDHVYFTSTMSVYSGAQAGYEEDDFNPLTYKVDPYQEVDYGEGKRQAEVVLFDEAPFAVTAFRFPIVLDIDDHTERLHFYVEKAVNNETIYFEKSAAKVNYVKGTTAAKAIVWAIENEKQGIYNVSAKDAVKIETLMKWIEEGVNHSLDVKYTGDKVANSPFSVSHDQYLISDKIENEGFELLHLEDWMKPLIQNIRDEMKGSGQ